MNNATTMKIAKKISCATGTCIPAENMQGMALILAASVARVRVGFSAKIWRVTATRIAIVKDN